jgi:hypothetical protein
MTAKHEIAKHESTSTQPTPAAITKAYKDLSTARHKLLIASLKLANSKYTLECNQTALVLNGVIDVGNETTCKAQLHDHLAELHLEIHQRTLDRESAQCRFDRAKLLVDELELQLKLLEVSLSIAR